METFIGDDKVILKLAGLRWIAKEDSSWAGAPTRFYLKWNYKGSDSTIQYENKEARDAMYLRLLEALTAET